MSKAEEAISRFYNGVGWETHEGVTEDARRCEDLRPAAADYVRRCRLRVLDHIPASGERILDMASGPIQYDEYLEYSRNFARRYCVDLSRRALDGARARIGDHGEYLHGSFFDLDIEAEYFDCAISLHTIYHIDRDRQEAAVRKLIRVTRPGRPVIIVYSNPAALAAGLRHSRPVTALVAAVRKVMRRRAAAAPPNDDSYFYRHPLAWWQRFDDECDVRIVPWRTLAGETQRRLIPGNRLGTLALRVLFALESRFPAFFVRHGTYPMIILTRRHDAAGVTGADDAAAAAHAARTGSGLPPR